MGSAPCLMMGDFWGGGAKTVQCYYIICVLAFFLGIPRLVGRMAERG